MENIKISIVTPSYNQGDYIEETIKSVLNQTYQNFEYIIFDSCSNDKTRQILDKYKNNEKIKIFIEKDKGQSNAINKGFKKSQGELIGWINSDDILEKDCLEKIIEKYRENKDLSIIFGNVSVIDKDGKPIGHIDSNNIGYNYLLNINPDVVQPGSFYNSKLVKKVNYLDESIHYTMDYDLWLRLLKINDKSIKIDSTLAKFRLHEESKTNSGGTFFKFWNNIFEIRKSKHGSKGIRKIHLLYVKRIFVAGFNKFF